MKLENILLQESYDFVKQNPNAALEFIPDYFLDLWIVKDPNEMDLFYQLFLKIYQASQMTMKGRESYLSFPF